MTVDTNHNYSLATEDEEYQREELNEDDLGDLRDYDYYYDEDTNASKFPEEPEQ